MDVASPIGFRGQEMVDLARRLERENDDLRTMRELCIKSLVKATGMSREAIEDGPFTAACRHVADVELRLSVPSERVACGWIPVGERLPDRSRHVALLVSDELVAIKHWPTAGYQDCDGRWWGGVPGRYINLAEARWEVTHWKDIGDRPKEMP